MAKRKYVKENNLVKAINTDSLELQKPLVNEYYDINVHNSNIAIISLLYSHIIPYFFIFERKKER